MATLHSTKEVKSIEIKKTINCLFGRAWTHAQTCRAPVCQAHRCGAPHSKGAHGVWRGHGCKYCATEDIVADVLKAL
jgi:hypothetical protein